MRHRKQRLQINRFTSWRKATLASLAKNLLIHQSIRTTLTRAKAARILTERLISLAKENSLAARRAAFKILQDHRLVKLLFSEIGPRFASRSSGFVRILNLGVRRGDNARTVILELTEIKKKEIKKPKKEKETKAAAQPPPAEGEPEQPQEKKPETGPALQEKPPLTRKPAKKFLGGLRNIFKKERDSL
jgi:large subunit ribosomal protein L17